MFELLSSKLGIGLGLLIMVAGWPALGETNGSLVAPPCTPLPASGEVLIPAQDVGGMTGRTVKVYIRYPAGRLAGVKPTTGLMLSLHNWGGSGFGGAPAPDVLAKRYDVVAIGVDYFQSGDLPTNSLPYDFGCYQACDALRGLYHVFQGLTNQGIAFDRTRIYVTGGSGGGNVSLMANKFAPHTFACVVDLSGMASLTDDIAFNLGGSDLNARYSRDINSPSFLTKGMQELRDPGNPSHLAMAAKRENTAKIVVVHGKDDSSCLCADKQRVVEAMQKAGLAVTPHYIGKQDVDGATIRNTGHSIGDRTELVERFAGLYLTPSSTNLCRLTGPTDFERRSNQEFPTSDGVYKISYANGWPELTFTKGKTDMISISTFETDITPPLGYRQSTWARCHRAPVRRDVPGACKTTAARIAGLRSIFIPDTNSRCSTVR